MKKQIILLGIFILLSIALVDADSKNAAAYLNISNNAPTVTSPYIIPSSPNIFSILNCSGGIYSDIDSQPENGRQWRWYINGLLNSSLNSQLLDLSSISVISNDKINCEVRVNDSIIWSLWNASSNVTISNFVPIISFVNNSPINADEQENILFFAIANDTEGQPMTAYCQLYRNSVIYGGVSNSPISNNILTNVCNASSSITSVNESWYADIYVSDGLNSSSVHTTSASTVGVFLNNIITSNFYNLTFNLNFTTILPTNFTVSYSYGDSLNLNNSISSGTTSLAHQITLPIDASTLFYYNITTFSLLNSQEIYGTYSTNYSCTEHWVCTSFGPCNGTAQTRSCTDLNVCATNFTKPSETTACTISPGGVGGNVYTNEVEMPNVSIEYVVRPLTCGNSIADYGETYFNCPSDIKTGGNLDLIERSACVLAGSGVCSDADKYSTEVIATWGVSLGALFLILKFGVLA